MSTMGTYMASKCSDIQIYNIVIYIQRSRWWFFRGKSNAQQYCPSEISQRQMWRRTVKPSDAA